MDFPQLLSALAQQARKIYTSSPLKYNVSFIWN